MKKWSNGKRSPEELAVYEANKKAMYTRDHWRCQHCNLSWSLTPHHILFQSQGGTDDLDNLITLCLVCHDKIHRHKVSINKSGSVIKFEEVV